MKIIEDAEYIAVLLLNKLGLAWWVEIVTHNPHCTYYFGPFISADSAKNAQVGYIEDIATEGAKINWVEVKQLQPKTLTILDEKLPKPAIRPYPEQ